MDDLALDFVVLLFWGSAVVVCQHDRKSAFRFLPLVALACSVGAASLRLPEVAAVCGGLSVVLLFWGSVNTSPSLIPPVLIFPVLSIAIGVGLNWILPWLGTTVLTVVHVLGLLLAGRSTKRDRVNGASSSSPGPGEGP